jgi:molybdate transport system substrate-binding protein
VTKERFQAYKRYIVLALGVLKQPKGIVVKYAFMPQILLALLVHGCATNTKIQTLKVFAASSLVDLFEDIRLDFEPRHQNVELLFNFAASQTLKLQIEQGARADVFVSADLRHIQSLQNKEYVGETLLFAHNEIALVVPSDNPSSIHSLHDLPQVASLLLGAPQVPVGRYGLQLIRAADRMWGKQFESRTLEKVVSEELNARFLRHKIQKGQADAALLYKSDAQSTPGLSLIPLPETLKVTTAYWAATVRDAASPKLAALWLAHLQSKTTQKLLRAHHFTLP